MAGYIGSKAVSLSTTSADVTGDADIGGTLSVTGETTVSSNVNFGDNDKAIFGAGSDLQIYHDGSNSYIKNNTGVMRIHGTEVQIKDEDNNETLAIFNPQGSVDLYYDNSKKLATTSTGVDITGTLTSDGLTVDAAVSTQATALELNGTSFADTERLSLDFARGGSEGVRLSLEPDEAQTNGDFIIETGGFGSTSDRLRIEANGDISFYEDTGTTAKFHWDAADERLGLGTTTPNSPLDIQASTSGTQIRLTYPSVRTWNAGVQSGGQFAIRDANAAADRLIIDSSGNLLVGKTSTNYNNTGVQAFNAGYLHATADGANVVTINRKTSDGDLVTFRKDGSVVGIIGCNSGNHLTIGKADTGVAFQANEVIAPYNPTANEVRDNAIDLGGSSSRFDDIFATNGTIQTSDQNEKQQIASLTNAEITAAKAISKLFKTFKWNDSVAEKGDAARTHAGVIAQDVEQAMTDAGLDAGDYAFFISSTWWETQTDVPAVAAVAEVLDEDGNVITEAVEAQEAYTRTDTYETLEEAPEGATERNRKGIRYPELLSFIGAATEQRLASIETRLDALEAN